MFTKSNLDMPEVKHPIYPGSSSGDLVGPINLESFPERLWQVTEDEKKKMYSSFRVAVGGPTDTAAQESAKRPQYKKNELSRAPTNLTDEATLLEPFSFHGLPPDYYTDMLHVWQPKALIGFTACDMTPAMICIERKVPYLGICFSEPHMVNAYKHLSELVFEAMQDESSSLHDAKLTALMTAQQLSFERKIF